MTEWTGRVFHGEVVPAAFGPVCCECGMELGRYVGQYENPTSWKCRVMCPACAKRLGVTDRPQFGTEGV